MADGPVLVMPLAGVESTVSVPGPQPRRQAWPAGERRLSAGCVTHLEDGTILLCGSRGLLSLQADGRLRRWPLGLDRLNARSLIDVDAALDGSLLVLTWHGVFRVGADGTASRLATLKSQLGSGSIAALPDGGAMLVGEWRRGQVLRLGAEGSLSVLLRRIPSYGADYVPWADVALLTDGSVAVVAPARVLRLTLDGDLSVIAGGGKGFVDGAPATAVDIGSVEAIASGPEGLVIGAEAGLLRLGQDGRLTRLTRPTENLSRPLAPTAVTTEGRNARLASFDFFERLDVLPGGAIAALTPVRFLLGSRLVAIAPLADVARLSVALPAEDRTLLRDGVVDVIATRPANATISVLERGRLLASIPATLSPGTTRVSLPVPRTRRALVLRVEASAPDGAIATHRLALLGSRKLSRTELRRLILLMEYELSGGMWGHDIKRCRRRDPSSFRCRWEGYGESPSQHGSAVFHLRDDGLVDYIQRNRRGKTQLHRYLEPR